MASDWYSDLAKEIRMILKRITILIFITFFLFLTAASQENWSLIKCIDCALINNLNNKTLELSEQSAKISFNQSKMNLLPSISASSRVGLNFGRQVDIDANGEIFTTNTETLSNSNSLNSSINLFNGFINMNRISFTKFQHEAARWQKINYEDNLAFNVMLAYYDVIYYQGLVEIAKEQLSLSGINLKKTEIQIETGLKAKADLAEMQAIYEKEQLNLIQSENLLEQVKLNLNQQMNLPVGSLVSLNVDKEESVLVKNLPVGTDSLFYSFVDFSPYVKMALADLKAEERNVALARGRFYPSIYLNASLNAGYYETNRDANGKTIPFKEQLDKNMSQYVGTSISIPIFSKNQTRSNLSKAKIEKQRAEIKLEDYKKTIYYELMNNTRELKALFREFHQTQKQVDADDFAYNVAERKYNEGIIDVIEMLTVKNRLAASKSQLLRSKTQWKVKSKMLDFYTGVRFWEVN